MRVLVINGVLSNGGDAAIYFAVKDMFAAASGGRAEFAVMDDNPGVVRALYPDEKVVASCFPTIWWYYRYPRLLPLARLLRLTLVRLSMRLRRLGLGWLATCFLGRDEARYVNLIDSADVVVATGGTYLTENYDFRHRAFDMANAIRVGKPLICMSQSVGRVAGRPGARELAWALSRARAVFARDQRSVTNLRDLMGRVRNVVSSPDVAFRFTDRPLRGTDRLAPKRVAVSVREWPYSKGASAKQDMAAFEQAVGALCDRLASEGCEVVMLSSCQGVDGYRYDDSVVARRIADACAHRDRILVDSDFHTPDVLREMLGGFDVVVATRMHVGILALSAGTPVFPIAYEFKSQSLFRDLGYPEVIDFEGLTGEFLCDSFARFCADWPAMSSDVGARIEDRRQALDQAVEGIRHVMTPPVPAPVSAGAVQWRRS